MKIPDYYRQFQNQQAKEEKKEDKESSDRQGEPVQEKQKDQKSIQPADSKDKTVVFHGNGFVLNQPEDWEDQTIYTITGPVTGGVQHNVIITIDKENPFDTLEEYAEWHIKTLETDLKSCTLMKKGEIKLTNGSEAYEAIFSWYPTDDLRIYQHQIFTQVGKAVFKMTASFTKKTRQTIGPKVLRMMLSLNPEPQK